MSMLQQIPAYVQLPAAMLIAVLVSIYAVRKLIFITRTRRLYDVPDNVRKIHGAQIPSLGGIGIFVGYLISGAFFFTASWYVVIAASVLLFFTGIYDDIMNMRPLKKLIAQALAATVVAVVLYPQFSISSLYGLMGLTSLPAPVAIFITAFCCTLFINMFNFMDGIDGLACTLAILYTGILGLLFYWSGHTAFAGISFSLAAATAGLLWFNRPPARIYMGDTGSMFLGFTIFVLAVACIGEAGSFFSGRGIPQSQLLMQIVSLLSVPVFDALRVFAIRMSRGISPLRADRLHLHYYLLDAGLSHAAAVGVITATNILVFAGTWQLRTVGPLVQLAFITALIAAVALWASRSRRRQA